MFFSKFLVSFVAALSFVTATFATPIAASNELVARETSADVVADIKVFAALVLPIIAEIGADVNVAANIDLLEGHFNDCKDSYSHKPSGILVAADLSVFVSVCVDIVVKLLVAISAIIILDLSIFAQIDVFLSAWLTVLDAFAPGCAALIGKGIPAVNVLLFVSLKLVLSAKVLVLVNIFGILGL